MTTKAAARATAALLAALLAAACAGEVPTEEEIAADNRKADYEQVMRFAETNRKGGDLGNAILFYRRASNLDPNKAAPLVGIADASLAMGDAAGAASAYGAAVSVAPDDPELRRDQGRALLVIDRPAEAAEAYREAIRLAPDDHRGYNGLGVALDLMGDFEGAQRNYIDGLEKSPDNLSLRNNLAISLVLREAYGEAIPLLRSIAEDPQATSRNRLNLALAYGLSGDTENAAAIAERVLDADAVRSNLAYYEELRTMTPVQRAAAILRREGGPGAAGAPPQ